MSRIRMAVKVANQTGEPLTFDSNGFDHGDWTDPWQPHDIAAGAPGEFRSEGDAAAGVPITGTDGWVKYNVGGDKKRQLYIHWDSPLIESQYGNTFHVWAPDGIQADHSGGQGHEATLSVTLRTSEQRRVHNFVPSVCGFHFSNGKWKPDLPVMTVGLLWNRLLDEFPDGLADVLEIAKVDKDWLPFTKAESQLCGGMVFAALDVFNGHRLPPADTTPPGSTDDPLYDHIRNRLLDSFDVTGGGVRWLAYSSPLYPNGDEGVIQAVGLARGRSWVTYRDEWPLIKEDIDANRPSPIGLIKTDSLDVGKNHQVLAYAYRQSGQQVEMWVYDPNKPDQDDYSLRFDITKTDGEVHVQHMQNGKEVDGARIFCIFRTNGYSPHSCPRTRPPEAMTLSDALVRTTGHRRGSFPRDVAGVSRPVALRSWYAEI